MQLSVSYQRNGDLHTIHTGGAALGDIVIDNSRVPAEQRGGTAKQLLGASVLFCFCAALNSALESRGVRYEDLRATATLDVDTNAGGQSRVLRITIDASLSLDEEDEDTFERVRKIMSRGCLVTGSLHDGIEMAYNLTPNYRED